MTIDWTAVDSAYKKMIDDDEQVIVSLKLDDKTREYYVWSCVGEDEEIWMLPLLELVEGPLYEMIPVNEFHLTLTSDFDKDETEYIVNMILDSSKHVKALFAESDEPDVDEMVQILEYNEEELPDPVYFSRMVKLSEPLPEGFTGKYFVFRDGAFAYKLD